MRILVTGGAGFIGSHFVRTLLGPDASEGPGGGPYVTVLDALTYAGNRAGLAPVEGDPRFSFVHGDIRDRPLVDSLLAGHDAVVHFAAESHVDRSIAGGTEFAATNVLGTQVLLESAVQHRIARFVHVSTDEVYGSIADGSWTEDEPLAPNSPYAASKAGSDLLALAHHRTHGLDLSVTRCSNNYGPYQHPEKVIPLFTTRLLTGGRVPLYGDGLHVRDWLHVDDHCRALRLVLEGGRPGEVYNIGGGTELSNRELTERLLAACGAGWDRVEHVTDRKGHDRRYSVDWTKIRTELGYEPRHSFEDGLAETVAWYRNHADWWTPAAPALGGAAR
ncbi:dTDP-glucose 4,6-dehydratase [Streptomyces sp. NRRL F-5755]|uniref:dTDP-glucose 4,6-dehydratase n=1 Tax=Streptomyces sp. NRRL F-5755 TaxID=1519475 RepID=UPI0006ADA261|nr:dTDP-glucose 4,6-dehydratase [Streptomyces sp. NRRL F-5755]KOT88513.1 dTDP-glucose 4,6-dehydratase [Streptomyces sp. NRRL F-5755]